jgi:PBP superfamily domain
MEGVIELGTCRNRGCPKGQSGEHIERYPGPGEYCPECGERLDPVPQPAGEPLPAGAYEAFGGRLQQLIAPPRSDAEGRKRVIIAGAIAIVLILIAMVIARQFAPQTPAVAARVCGSSGSDALATTIVRAYAVKNGSSLPYLIDPPGVTRCDVRFWIATKGTAGGLLAHDAVVAVVHPQNGLTRLTTGQLRGIFAGTITDWSQLGDQPGAIVALLPDDVSDELRVLRSSTFRGLTISSGVHREASSAAIVHRVASASGRRLIGLVTFSGAVPAKVVALGSATPPSTLSIADRRYPLSFDVMVGSDLPAPSDEAAKFIAYARSDEAQTVVARAAFVGKKGL